MDNRQDPIGREEMELRRRSIERGDIPATDLKGNSVRVTGVGISIIGTIMEAYEDLEGTIQLIKIKKADGKIELIEVGEMTVSILDLVGKWFPRLWAWIVSIVEKRENRRTRK